jgi:AbrB family looped-hinge helix DNA binding protein
VAEAALTSKGQITIPVEVRRSMGLKPQDRIVFTLLPDGTTVMRPKTRPLEELAGSLKRKESRKVSSKDMRIGRE